MTIPKRPNGTRWIATITRHRIYVRDACTCVYCGHLVSTAACPTHRLATLDHVRPRSKGGKNVPSNLVTACESCNSSRRHTDLLPWLSRLYPADRVLLILRNVRNARRRKLSKKRPLMMCQLMEAARILRHAGCEATRL